MRNENARAIVEWLILATIVVAVYVFVPVTA